MRLRARVLVALLALGASVLVSPARVAGGTSGVVERAGEKLERGLVNLGTGWAEILKQPYLIGKEHGWLAGTLRGPVEGLGMVVARTVSGAYEILTFPLPIPSGYQPMVEPDYVWQDERDRSAPGDGPEARGAKMRDSGSRGGGALTGTVLRRAGEPILIRHVDGEPVKQQVHGLPGRE